MPRPYVSMNLAAQHHAFWRDYITTSIDSNMNIALDTTSI
jgi:hypothetical protein